MERGGVKKNYSYPPLEGNGVVFEIQMQKILEGNRVVFETLVKKRF